MRKPGYSVDEAPDASDASETLGHFLSGRFHGLVCLRLPVLKRSRRPSGGLCGTLCGGIETLFISRLLSTGAMETELKRS